jgi:hypothetical protein
LEYIQGELQNRGEAVRAPAAPALPGMAFRQGDQ